MENLLKYKGYRAKTYYSDEDACFVGEVVGINDVIGFDGESVEELHESFHEAVDAYLESCADLVIQKIAFFAFRAEGKHAILVKHHGQYAAHIFREQHTQDLQFILYLRRQTVKFRIQVKRFGIRACAA